MRLVALFALMTGASAATGIPGWAYMAATLVTGGFGIRYYLAKVEKRLKAAEVSRTDAETDLTSAQAKEIEDRLRMQLMENVDRQMRGMREEVSKARASEAQALSDLTAAQAANLKMQAQHQEERHGLKRLVEALQDEVASLRAELADLQGKLLMRERRTDGAGRRVDDDEIGSASDRT